MSEVVLPLYSSWISQMTFSSFTIVRAKYFLSRNRCFRSWRSLLVAAFITLSTKTATITLKRPKVTRTETEQYNKEKPQPYDSETRTKIGLPSVSAQSDSTMHRNTEKNAKGTVRKYSAPRPRSSTSPSNCRKAKLTAYTGIAMSTMHQPSIRKPPKMPRIMVPKAAKAFKRVTRKILNILSSRTIPSNLDVAIKTTSTRSNIETNTNPVSNWFKNLSGPEKNLRQPDCLALNRRSPQKSRSKTMSKAHQPIQSGFTSALTPSITMFAMTAKPTNVSTQNT
mmetsp:Transcript_33882/g.97474  ORF Transcript_33882/g.97474 Transcript_33882/m.97474 type:complete len:281 (-) Transcript_33882:653-1495(-)